MLGDQGLLYVFKKCCSWCDFDTGLLVRFWKGGRSPKKSMLCTLLTILTIMDDPRTCWNSHTTHHRHIAVQNDTCPTYHILSHRVLSVTSGPHLPATQVQHKFCREDRRGARQPLGTTQDVRRTEEDQQELSPGHYEGGAGGSRGVGEGGRGAGLRKINKSYPLVTTKVGLGRGGMGRGSRVWEGRGNGWTGWGRSTRATPWSLQRWGWGEGVWEGGVGCGKGEGMGGRAEDDQQELPPGHYKGGAGERGYGKGE